MNKTRTWIFEKTNKNDKRSPKTNKKSIHNLPGMREKSSLEILQIVKNKEIIISNIISNNCTTQIKQIP